MHRNLTEHKKLLIAIPFQRGHLYYKDNFSAVTSTLHTYNYLALPAGKKKKQMEDTWKTEDEPWREVTDHYVLHRKVL